MRILLFLLKKVTINTHNKIFMSSRMHAVQAVYVEEGVEDFSDEGWMSAYDVNFPPLGIEKENPSLKLRVKNSAKLTPGKEDFVNRTLKSLRSAGNTNIAHEPLPSVNRRKSVASL